MEREEGVAVRLWQKVLDLFYPPRCVFCGRLLKEGEEDACKECRSVLPVTEGLESEKRNGQFDRCVAPFFYTGLVRESFHRYKFQGYSGYASAYGRWMSQCVEDELGEPFDVVTWAPLSRERLRERGYDQARLLAREVARSRGMKEERLLEKVRDTPAQSGLSGSQSRWDNVRGAYRLAPGEDVSGLCVLLVDDIVTTGATLSECAEILKSAGAKRVLCAVLARGQLG